MYYVSGQVGDRYEVRSTSSGDVDYMMANELGHCVAGGIFVYGVWLGRDGVHVEWGRTDWSNILVIEKSNIGRLALAGMVRLRIARGALTDVSLEAVNKSVYILTDELGITRLDLYYRGTVQIVFLSMGHFKRASFGGNFKVMYCGLRDPYDVFSTGSECYYAYPGLEQAMYECAAKCVDGYFLSRVTKGVSCTADVFFNVLNRLPGNWEPSFMGGWSRGNMTFYLDVNFSRCIRLMYNLVHYAADGVRLARLVPYQYDSSLCLFLRYLGGVNFAAAVRFQLEVIRLGYDLRRFKGLTYSIREYLSGLGYVSDGGVTTMDITFILEHDEKSVGYFSVYGSLGRITSDVGEGYQSVPRSAVFSSDRFYALLDELGVPYDKAPVAYMRDRLGRTGEYEGILHLRCVNRRLFFKDKDGKWYEYAKRNGVYFKMFVPEWETTGGAIN